MMPKKQFEGWLRHQLFVDIDNGQCSKFILKHVTSASRAGHTVLTIDVPREEGQPDDNWIQDNVKLIEETALADASGQGGVQGYVIFSFHGEDTDKPTARFSIRMAGEPNAEEDDISSEPPTKTGIISQVMRHNEAIMRSSMMTTSTVMTLMQRTLAQQASVIEKLTEEKFNNINIVESLLSQKNERDIEAEKAKETMALKRKAFDTLSLVAPTLVNKMLTSGNPNNAASPQAISARDAQLAALADTFTTEQLEKMQSVFTPDQLMIFIDVFSQIKQQQQTLLETNKK